MDGHSYENPTIIKIYLFRNDTIENVERKQARTEGERQESDGEMSEEDGDDDDDDDIPYNPKVRRLF